MYAQTSKSDRRGIPVDGLLETASALAVTGETVQFYYNNAGTLTADAGQAAGIVVVGKLKYNHVLNKLGGNVGVYGDTSLSFTSTAFTSEMVPASDLLDGFDDLTEVERLVILAGVSTTQLSPFTANGKYFVDYNRGYIYGLKASTQTTLTSTAYSVPTQTETTASGSVAVTSVVPGTGATNLGKAEDAAASSGDVGVFVLGVRNDTNATSTSTDGDYAQISVDLAGNSRVVGNVATLTTDAGNPVKVGGVYNTSAPAPTNGQRVDMQMDSAGNERIAEQFAPQAEDNTNGVYAEAIKPLATSAYSWTSFQNLGANATLNVKSSAGNIKSLYCLNNNAAVRYIGIYNSATTASGTPTLNYMIPPAVGGVPGVVFIDGQLLGENGFNLSTGIAFGFSTSSSTYSAGSAGDMLILQIMYK